MKKIIHFLKIATILLVVSGVVLSLGSLFYIPKDLISARIAGETSFANAVGACGGVIFYLGMAFFFLLMAIAINVIKNESFKERRVGYWTFIILMIMFMTIPFATFFNAFKNMSEAYRCFSYGAENLLSIEESLKFPLWLWIIEFICSFVIFMTVAHLGKHLSRDVIQE